MSELDRIIRNMCTTPNFEGATASEKEIDEFLLNNSTIYFCRGIAFHIEFEKITNMTYRVKRRWA